MAKRTVVERGRVSATGSHEPYPDPATIDSLLLNLINIEIELVKRDKTWLDCIVMCVVPRYAEELILVELYVEQNHRGMTNKQLFEALINEVFLRNDCKTVEWRFAENAYQNW